MDYQNKELKHKYANNVNFRRKADQLEDQYEYLRAKTTQMT